MPTAAPLQNKVAEKTFVTSIGKTVANPLQMKGAKMEGEPFQLQINPLQFCAERSTQNPLKAPATVQNPLQFKAANTNPLQLAAEVEPSVQKKVNNTGLPDDLKAGVENVSGFSMDDVRVHYNSDKPAQLQALAYTQGIDIHIAPGQERHLPHEAWHVVQQKQGRVQPTLQMKGGVAVNDDKGLENEADALGERAVRNNVQKNTEMVKQVNLFGKITQCSRKKELGANRKYIKLVLPGSGDLHWRTRTPNEITNMIPIGSAKEQQYWVRTGKQGHYEYSIAGPQNLGGVSDTGPNQIAENVELGTKLMKEAVENEIKNGTQPGNITVLIKSHSRNAVAGSQIAKNLSAYFYSYNNNQGTYPEVELTMFDPVPGPLHQGEHLDADVGMVHQSIVVYSILTQYALGFSPQKIRGAKRMIISYQDHGVGTNSSFKYADTLYKGSNLNSLPEGLFVGDGQGAVQNVEKISKIRSTGELQEALNKISKITPQYKRGQTIEEIANTFNLIKSKDNKEKSA